MTFTKQYLGETRQLVDALSTQDVEALAISLAEVRDHGGRLFILGVGGSAAHASHAVGDFRKICGWEAYAPTDNVAELTARANDDGWDTTLAGWLQGSRLGPLDGVLVFSVGGGSVESNVSVNLVRALDYAVSVGAKVFGIVGRDGGWTARLATACVVIPPLFAERVTAHTEGLAAVLWHLLVSHPRLKVAQTKWESSTSLAPSTGGPDAGARPGSA
jgi:D-sedoheptulose 7-phosphate isomerase